MMRSRCVRQRRRDGRADPALALARGGLRWWSPIPCAAIGRAGCGFDGRVWALSYSSVRMFEALGVWQIWRLMRSRSTTSSSPMPRWAARRAFLVAFRPSRDRPADGLHRREPPHPPALYAAVARRRRSSLDRAGHAARGLHAMRRHARRPGSGRRRIQARLAGGRRRPRVRWRGEQMGIGIIGWSYPQWGIVATVAHEQPA